MSHLTAHRAGFPDGYTAVTRAADPANATGIGFGVLRLAAGERWSQPVERETAWLLMSGSLRVGAGDVEAVLSRVSLFDESASCLQVELVLGEVVTFPGGWASYPPHHHPQPEIYHYRFTAPQGYGHAELGEQVVKVRQYDSICIPAGNDHAQCAAPGYGMYYSWVIRHLPGLPYTVPEFTPEHAWTMAPGAQFWWPGDESCARRRAAHARST